MTTTKPPVTLICECGEEWTYRRPKGKRGRNPSTNPEHKRCGDKRQNKNRALSRERQRSGQEYFHWNLPAPDKAQNLTVEEEVMSMDVAANPWWITESHMSEGSKESCVPDEWRPRLVAMDVRYSNAEDDQRARTWLSETRTPALSGCDVGRTAERDHTVIGSAQPWWIVGIPHPGSNRPLDNMEPFSLVL